MIRQRYLASETSERTCVAFGPVMRGSDHVGCPVTKDGYVCKCECLDCKRMWWDAGRPKTGRIESSE